MISQLLLERLHFLSADNTYGEPLFGSIIVFRTNNQK